MPKSSLQVLVTEQKILNKIYVMRSEKVMLDEDLSLLCDVETKQLKPVLLSDKKHNFPLAQIDTQTITVKPAKASKNL